MLVFACRAFCGDVGSPEEGCGVVVGLTFLDSEDVVALGGT